MCAQLNDARSSLKKFNIVTIKNIESDVDMACKRRGKEDFHHFFIYFILENVHFPSIIPFLSFPSFFIFSHSPPASTSSSSYSLLHPFFFIFSLQHTFSYVAALTRKTSFLLFSSLMEKHFNLKASLLHPSHKYIRILHLNVIIFLLSLTHSLSLSHSCC